MTLDHVLVDNCAMALVHRPTQFDTIVTENTFGDILSDEAAILAGSMGMLPSASLGGPVGLYEPVHGTAPDIAGQGHRQPDRGDPVGGACCCATRSTTGRTPTASSAAVMRVLEQGHRTARHRAAEGRRPSAPREMGDLIVQRAGGRQALMAAGVHRGRGGRHGRRRPDDAPDPRGAKVPGAGAARVRLGALGGQDGDLRGGGRSRSSGRARARSRASTSPSARRARRSRRSTRRMIVQGGRRSWSTSRTRSGWTPRCRSWSPRSTPHAARRHAGHPRLPELHDHRDRDAAQAAARRRARLRRVVATSYQAVSGAGVQRHRGAARARRSPGRGARRSSPKHFAHQIAFNLIPAIDTSAPTATRARR